VALYYGLLVALGWALAAAWPLATTAFRLERLQQLSANDPLARVFGQGPSGIGSLRLIEGMGVTAVSMLGALALMVPLAWSYIIIKRRSGYDQSVVHTLLILPVAVTGIVEIVQNSTALAFSLAGIMAGVRFRTSLEDTKDAAYIFVAIAIGLAAGVQALGIALVLSLVFNVLNLTLWRLGFGDMYVDQKGHAHPLTLGDALAGSASAKRAVRFGDAQLLDRVTADELKEAADRAARLERHLQATGETKKDRKAYSVLLIYTDQVPETQQAVEPHLGQLCVRWSLAEIIPVADGSGVSILQYLVRPREDVAEETLMDTLRNAGAERVRAAELRSLKTLAKKR
jgi:hypothetical protein